MPDVKIHVRFQQMSKSAVRCHFEALGSIMILRHSDSIRPDRQTGASFVDCRPTWNCRIYLSLRTQTNPFLEDLSCKNRIPSWLKAYLEFLNNVHTPYHPWTIHVGKKNIHGWYEYFNQISCPPFLGIEPFKRRSKLKSEEGTFEIPTNQPVYWNVMGSESKTAQLHHT